MVSEVPVAPPGLTSGIAEARFWPTADPSGTNSGDRLEDLFLTDMVNSPFKFLVKFLLPIAVKPGNFMTLGHLFGAVEGNMGMGTDRKSGSWDDVVGGAFGEKHIRGTEANSARALSARALTSRALSSRALTSRALSARALTSRALSARALSSRALSARAS